MEHARAKPGMKVVVEDETRMEKNAKNALKQRKWQTMRGMVQQAEKLSKEVPTMEFLVVLSFEGGIKFTGTGSLLDHFKNGEPLTDVKPRGVSYTKDTQNDVVDCFEPPCIEVSTPEGSTAGYPDTELSDLYQNVRRQLIPEQMEPPTQNANVEPEGCSDQATSHKRARQVTHAANTLEEEEEEEQPRSVQPP
ncbi:uncharacterized protein LOC124291106 [Haliotis rubra]|uniref:uncharacterized protein LOC124291106 n=1 Tax=Haliotis rubra TaxID=36100 RepID=UPI001EE5DE8C|nr:uncharacterized protein LOC124291106 [Haliotis rubra]